MMTTETSKAQILARKHALKLELKGIKRRGRSVYAIVKEEHGLKGNKQSVYDQYCQIVNAVCFGEPPQSRTH